MSCSRSPVDQRTQMSCRHPDVMKTTSSVIKSMHDLDLAGQKALGLSVNSVHNIDIHCMTFMLRFWGPVRPPKVLLRLVYMDDLV